MGHIHLYDFGGIVCKTIVAMGLSEWSICITECTHIENANDKNCYAMRSTRRDYIVCTVRWYMSQPTNNTLEFGARIALGRIPFC